MHAAIGWMKRAPAACRPSVARPMGPGIGIFAKVMGPPNRQGHGARVAGDRTLNRQGHGASRSPGSWGQPVSFAKADPVPWEVRRGRCQEPIEIRVSRAVGGARNLLRFASAERQGALVGGTRNLLRLARRPGVPENSWRYGEIVVSASSAPLTCRSGFVIAPLAATTM
jgi:hypothetical protein